MQLSAQDALTCDSSGSNRGSEAPSCTPSLMQRSKMEFDLGNGERLSITLFADVTNSKELLQAMQEGKLKPEMALLNASLIPNVFPILVAAYKSFLAKSRESLTTRTLHSELVYNYSGSKHITESLKRCGISDSTTYILVARFNASCEEPDTDILEFDPPRTFRQLNLARVFFRRDDCSDPQDVKSKSWFIGIVKMKCLGEIIRGREIGLEELEGRANVPHILKHYKISPAELGISSLADAITCRIAARDAL